MLLQIQLPAQSNPNYGLFTSRNKQDEHAYDKGDPSGGSHGGEPVPIGSGLLVLTGLSMVYACIKHSRKEDWISLR